MAGGLLFGAAGDLSLASKATHGSYCKNSALFLSPCHYLPTCRALQFPTQRQRLKSSEEDGPNWGELTGKDEEGNESLSFFFLVSFQITYHFSHYRFSEIPKRKQFERIVPANSFPVPCYRRLGAGQAHCRWPALWESSSLSTWWHPSSALRPFRSYTVCVRKVQQESQNVWNRLSETSLMEWHWGF